MVKPMIEAPRLIFWELTKRCNLRCGYCRVLKDESGRELDTKEALELISNIKKEFGDTLLIISGGEPLLRKDLFKILSHAFSVGLETAIATNGTLLGEQEALKLKKAGVKRVSISLDSIEEEAHDVSKGINGSFRKALKSISVLNRHKIPFQINFTVTNANKDQMLYVARFALLMGAEAVHYFILVPTVCGMRIEEGQVLNARDTDEVLLKIKDMSEKMPIELRPTCAPHYVRYVEEGTYGGCLAARSVFFISSEGNIYPCGYFPVKAGSLREEYIGDIWRDSGLFKELRQNSLKGSCSDCRHKDTCRGCRARSYSLTGDYLAEDVTCSMSGFKG